MLLFFMPPISDFCQLFMEIIKYWIKKNFAGWLYRRQLADARKDELKGWIKQFTSHRPSALSDVSFDVFTYHGEDGIIFYLLQQLKSVPSTFVDIGAGDGIKSNCANLAVHYGWTGIFIDQNKKQLAIGKSFYKKVGSKNNKHIQFINEEIRVDNVNQVIEQAGINGPVGLLSIDIDGNDYWIWKAIEIIQPRIIVIEAKVEFGYQDIIVPYSPDNHHAVDKLYNGASVEALRKLGIKKGYKLAGSNLYGYNLFFIKETEMIKAITTEQVMKGIDCVQSFYPESFFSAHTFVTE
jgi:hypothetical protein